jgi:two-component system, chemotaxis family, chemotaxis protein CheY
MKEKMKVMIVDDSSIIRKLISSYIDEYNIEIVAEASDGKKALDLFTKFKPDIVTMDIVMPEMDGLTVIEKMLKIDNKVKIMAITALNDKSTGIEAIKLGAKSFMLKPFTPEKIKTAFSKLIG